MKTKSTKPVQNKRREPETENESFYVTLPSTLNRRVNPENDDDLGYPDFFEETDNMNRYLW